MGGGGPWREEIETEEQTSPLQTSAVITGKTIPLKKHDSITDNTLLRIIKVTKKFLENLDCI